MNIKSDLAQARAAKAELKRILGRAQIGLGHDPDGWFLRVSAPPEIAVTTPKEVQGVRVVVGGWSLAMPLRGRKTAAWARSAGRAGVGPPTDGV